ncbi:MAG: hypothetical protein WCG83_05055 [Candidatus Peregrinibacteria bacterium]
MEAKKHIHVYGKWVSTLGIGLLGNWAITWAFDFLLYPYVIFRFGLFYGAPLMTFLSFLICYATILFYDATKKDWLGIETIKGIREFIPKEVPESGIGRMVIKIGNRIGKWSSWLLKRSDAFLMVVLSIKFDPFITVIHIRHGAHQFNGLTKRDWKIFLLSLLIGNAYWTLTVLMGITLVEAVWQFVVKIF